MVVVGGAETVVVGVVEVVVVGGGAETVVVVVGVVVVGVGVVVAGGTGTGLRCFFECLPCDPADATFATRDRLAVWWAALWCAR